MFGDGADSISCLELSPLQLVFNVETVIFRYRKNSFLIYKMFFSIIENDCFRYKNSLYTTWILSVPAFGHYLEFYLTTIFRTPSAVRTM